MPEEQGQRTEKPTKRRLDKARREGQFPASREFLAGLQFLTFVTLAGSGGAQFLRGVAEMVRYFLGAAFRIQLTPHGVANIYWAMLGHVFPPLLWMGLCLVTVAMAGQMGVTRLGLAYSKLVPDLKRLSPLQKIKSVPAQNMASFLQAVVFLPFIALAVYSIARDNLAIYAGLSHASIPAALQVMAGTLKTLLWKAAILFAIIGCLDLLRVSRRHNKSLRMSKQEMREEAKETEGNPQMKGRIRRIQRDMARRNMMKEVPNATAVIVNPTHYSVAIRYEAESMAAPLVLAKGKNYLAKRIREIAMEHQIPIVENQPLAQALYNSADVGQEIPPHLYRAVAEVLAYIFKLMHPRRN
jgi:flagellar biosynthesis protein FlhB